MEKLISEQFHEGRYQIRKNKDLYRYKLTIPKYLLDEAGIENRQNLGFKVKLNDNGELILVYTTNKDECSLFVTVSKHSSGELTVPSALAASLNMSKYNIKWKLESYENYSEFHAISNFKLEEKAEKYTDLFAVKPLSHITQEVNSKDESWSQEHFRLYLTIDEVDDIKWKENQSIGLQLINIDGNIGIKLTPDTVSINNKSIKKVKSTGEKQKDLFLYIPNDIVKSINFNNKTLDWLNEDSSLILREAK